MSPTAACPECGAPIDFKFLKPFKDIAHMIFNNEYVTLEPFPMLIHCTACSWQRETVGREFTIDIEAGRVLLGRVDKPPA